jgi:serine/threonine-protein kinase
MITAGAQFCMRCGADVSGAHQASASKATTVVDSREAKRDLLETLRADLLGEYEVFAELGSGGMATVFLAHDIQLDRKVAIKVMLPALLLGDGMAERFKLEARTAARLSHAHIIPIYAVKESQDLICIIMKFVDGRPLDSIIKEVEQLPIPMVQTVITRVGEALSYAHRNGVVHRDVKPANIMIDVEGMPVVTDFGIAKVAHAQGLTMTGATIGTPTYMSPEQATGGVITGATDQYSLGVVAFEMLTGKPPFEADTSMTVMYKHCHDPLPSLSALRPDCPPALAAAVEQMLAKEPSDRWPSMEEALSRVGRVALAFEDPVRTQMMDLALAGENRALLKRISTPVSPMPLPRGDLQASRPEDSGGVEAETVKMASHQRSSINATPKPRHRRPIRIVVGVVSVAVVAALTAVLGPKLTREGSAPPGAPQEASAAAVSGLTVTPEQTALSVDETVQLLADAVDESGGTASEFEVTWTSDDPAVATVSPTGLITALAAGSTVVRARGEGLVAGSQIVVLELELAEDTPAPAEPAASEAPAGPVPVASLTMEDAPATVTVGDTRQLQAVTRDRQGSPLGRRVAWSSDNPAVARVSSSGVVSALSAGTATIAATSEGQTASVSIAVLAEAVDRVTVSPASPAALEVGSTTRLTAAAWSAKNQELLGRETVWSSSDASVATVSTNGTVTAVGPGETEISVSVDARVTAVAVTVNAVVTEAAPASLEPSEEIALVIERYARALESKDLGQVRNVFPSISAAQVSQLEESFASMRDLVVILNVDRLEVNGDVAQATVSGTYQFYNTDSRRDRDVAVGFQMTLRRLPEGWLISETR